MDTGLAILISAIMATVGWYMTNNRTQRISRRQHTYDVHSAYRARKPFLDKLKAVKTLFRDANIPQAGDASRLSDIESIDWILNHYEFISAAIVNGDIDEALLRSCEESRMKKIVTNLRTYIDDDRILEEQPTMHENLIKLVDRWESNTLSPAQMAYEIFLQKPCLEVPRYLSWIDDVLDSHNR
jgi:hypothetical protein